jgi:hypothetical protein
MQLGVTFALRAERETTHTIKCIFNDDEVDPAISMDYFGVGLDRNLQLASLVMV